jgi:hypothetical protein
MVLFVVKILAAGFRRAMDSDVLASILSMQFGKFQRILKYFESYLLEKAYVVLLVRFI